MLAQEIAGKVFQSTPPARGATQRRGARHPHGRISIHAPREGGDGPSRRWPTALDYFNPRPPRGGRLCGRRLVPLLPGISIHAPREGGDDYNKLLVYNCQEFQSTPPARGATPMTASALASTLEFQSTPPARGGDASWKVAGAGS